MWYNIDNEKKKTESRVDEWKVYSILYHCESEVKKTMKEKIKITITLTDDNIVLYGENTQDLTEDDIIDINKMLGGLAKTSSILQEGDSTDGNA